MSRTTINTIALYRTLCLHGEANLRIRCMAARTLRRLERQGIDIRKHLGDILSPTEMGWMNKRCDHWFDVLKRTGNLWSQF